LENEEYDFEINFDSLLKLIETDKWEYSVEGTKEGIRLATELKITSF